MLPASAQLHMLRFQGIPLDNRPQLLRLRSNDPFKQLPFFRTSNLNSILSYLRNFAQTRRGVTIKGAIVRRGERMSPHQMLGDDDDEALSQDGRAI